MKRTRSMQSVLAAVVFACGMMGSMECSIDPSRPQHFPRGDFAISGSTATAGETRGPVRRASCAVVRYYVARYTRQLRRHGLEARARPTPKSRPPGTASNPNSRCCSATLLAERIREIGVPCGILRIGTVSGYDTPADAGIPSHASANGAVGRRTVVRATHTPSILLPGPHAVAICVTMSSGAASGAGDMPCADDAIVDARAATVIHLSIVVLPWLYRLIRPAHTKGGAPA